MTILANLIVLAPILFAWQFLQCCEATDYGHEDTGPFETPWTFWCGLAVILLCRSYIGEAIKAVAGWLQ